MPVFGQADKPEGCVRSLTNIAEALEQVKTLAEAAQNPQDGALQKAAKTATKIIKGTIATLPPTTALVEAVTKLLPLITKFFGF